MKKILLTLGTLTLLTACAADSISAYRWHRSGASEAEVAKQKRTCQAQAQHDAKQGKTPKSLEQCMDEAGYYRYEHGNL